MRCSRRKGIPHNSSTEKSWKISGYTIIATLPPDHALSNDKKEPPQGETQYRREKTLALMILNMGQTHPNCKTDPINVGYTALPASTCVSKHYIINNTVTVTSKFQDQ
jgi:hypothetical protein